jgi:DNA polymerase-1
LVEGLEQYSADKKAPNYLGKLAKAKRQSAKVYALGIPYSMTGYKLQYELDVPLEHAEALVRRYLDAFPNLSTWMRETAKTVYTAGQIRTQSGRIRHLGKAQQIYKKYGQPILDDLELWKSLNHMPSLYAAAKAARREFKNLLANGTNVQIQGLVASMMNRSCIAIAREFKAQKLEATIVAQLHDQVVVHCPESLKDQVAAIVQDKMENTMRFSVPMIAVPSFGYNLRDSKGD